MANRHTVLLLALPNKGPRFCHF